MSGVRDADRVPAGERLATDICIVGAGPVGLTLADELLGCGRRITILESGREGHDDLAGALAGGEVSGDHYVALERTRRRQLGGTTHLWNTRPLPDRTGMRLRPLEPIDFEQRDAVPHSGWPFSYEDLVPFYAAVAERWGVSDLDLERLAAAGGPAPWPLDGTDATSVAFGFGTAAFVLEDLLRRVVEAPDVDLYVGAHVVGIRPSPDGDRVEGVTLGREDGSRVEVDAKVVVLATGGIENARLLLLSNREHPRGMGNQHDLVGRFFMEHPHLVGGLVVPHDRTLLDRSRFYDVHQVRGIPVMGKLTLREEALRRHGLRNVMAFLLPRPPPSVHRPLDAAQRVKAQVRMRTFEPRRLARWLADIALGVDHVVEHTWRYLRYGEPLMPDPGSPGWSELQRPSERFATFETRMVMEQAPDPANRVTLGTRRDPLGAPVAHLHNRVGRDDFDSLARAERVLAAALDEGGLGHVRLPDRYPAERNWAGAHHHIGTTRMHASEREGVVDPEGAVHGLPNLLVAGVSTFPTGGYANPTMTALALAVRLGRRLRSQVGPPLEVP